MYRSLLFVPADSEKKIAKAETVDADLVILDLEDSVAAPARPAARRLALDALSKSRGRRRAALYVRINPLATPDAPLDLAAVVPGAPDGIMLPKAASPADIARLARELAALESTNGIANGAVKIIPVATEVPQALFAIGGYAGVTERLAGLTWGAEDLSAAIGATATREATGEWTDPYRLARALCLFAAAAAGVPAYDTVYTDFKDEKGLAAYARRARRDGFSGMMAIHPAQVAAINAAFAPDASEISEAQAIVDLFAANPGAGTLSHDGRMVDMPHLIKARKTLALAERAKDAPQKR
ncbi:MAG: CoA ester lyase [Parvularculaceae bacterium]|nr:CoA ester lyase [Parvularculaceae bacterium]